MPVVTSNGRSRSVIVNRDRTIATIRDGTTSIGVSDTRTANTVERDTRVLNVSSPGAQGPAGTPGGSADERIASEILGGHRIVRSTSKDGAGYSHADNAAHGDDTLGLTLGASGSGDVVVVQRTGSVTHAGWSWAQGEPIFHGLNSLPTQVVPTMEDGYAFQQVIGYAESVDTLYLNIESPVYF